MPKADISPESSVFKKASVRQTSWLLLAAWLIPLGISLIPWTGRTPLGDHLLPMFWTALVAVYFHGLILGLIVGLFAPVLTLLIVGVQAYTWVTLAALEVVLFVAATWALVRWRPRFWLAGALAYLIARTGSTLLEPLLAPSAQATALGGSLLGALRNGAPGLGLLLVINLALVQIAARRRRANP